MKSEILQNKSLTAIREYTFNVLDKHSDTNSYTNINRLFRIEKNIKTIIKEDDLTNIDINAIFLANYLANIEQAENPANEFDFSVVIPFVTDIITTLKNEFETQDLDLEKAKTILEQSIPINKPILLEAKILADAFIMDFAFDKGRDRLKSLYAQMVVRDFNISKIRWYDVLIPILDGFSTATNYGKTYVQPEVEKLAKSIKKELKEINKNRTKIIQKELQISDDEIKQLKKEISKVKKRDDRGIQTLFRNVSKSHYTLNQMVDRKASIMITVNSIILSLVMGGIIGKFDTADVFKYIPIFILATVNIFSIIFAIIAITPAQTQGNFTEEEIRNKQGNLLYYGNFHNMAYRDFEWGFLQMLNDKDYLYGSMIRDFYYQGQSLDRKYKFIRIALNIFLIGLILTIIAFGITRIIL